MLKINKSTSFTADKSYVISIAEGSNYYLSNTLHVEKNDELGLVESDEEACIEAEKDGVKLIYGMIGIPDRTYVDTEENRKIILEQLNLYPYYLFDVADKEVNEMLKSLLISIRGDIFRFGGIVYTIQDVTRNTIVCDQNFIVTMETFLSKKCSMVDTIRYPVRDYLSSLRNKAKRILNGTDTYKLHEISKEIFKQVKDRNIL